MISSEECITQQKLLVWDLVVSVSMKCQQIPAEVGSAWEYIKNGLFKAADEICGWT